MSKSYTISKNINDGVVVAVASVTFTGDDIVVGSNKSTFSSNEFITSATAKYVTKNYSYVSEGDLAAEVYLSFNGSKFLRAYYSGDAAPNVSKTLSFLSSGITPRTYNANYFFNSNNKTEKEIDLSYTVGEVVYVSDESYVSSYYYARSGSDVVRMGNREDISAGTVVNLGQKLVLDAPPTYNVTQISYDKSYIYADLTTASITISEASAKYGGDIVSSSFTIGGQTVTGTGDGTLSILLDTAGTFTPTVTVTDSRGQTTTTTFDAITVSSYSSPEVAFTLERTNASGIKDDEGIYAVASATFNWSGAIATLSQPTVTAIDGDGTSITVSDTWYTDRTLATAVDWSDTSSWSSPKVLYGKIGTLPVNESSQITVTPNDSEGSGTAQTQTLASAFYTIDFLAGGHGIAFGQPASEEGFFCNMDSHFSDKAHVMRALFDFVYPVGSYYETSDTTFDPNVTWGGTWALETEGQVHISAGANYSVAGALTNTTDGGSKDAVVVSHTHKVSSGWQSASGQPDRITYGGVNGGYNNAGYGGVQFIESVGVDGTNKNLQPYIVVNRWHRTA